MEEYEYSFNVKTVEPYIDYCKENNYILKKVVKQNRIVYENKNNRDVIARFTTTFNDDVEECLFDCKNIKKSENDLKESIESIPIKVNKNNRIGLESMLNILNFYISANNTRIRYVYIKDGVKLEIDDYSSPKMCVIGIEGKKEEVDKVYSELKYRKI